jgi:ABC-type sugar transport system substrate-binding protein
MRIKFDFSMKFIICIIITLIISSIFSGCAKGSKMTIAFIGYSSTQPFWIGLRDAAKEEAEKSGVDFLDFTEAEADAALQKQAIDNAILQKVDGIILGAVDTRALDDTLNKARDAKIPVVTVDSGIEHDWISSLIQTDNLAAANIAGEYILKNMKEGKILINGGSAGHQTGDARRDGVKNLAEKKGVEVIYKACDWAEDKAYENVINELTANPDITAVFNACDPMAMGTIAAAKEKGVHGKILIVGFDGNPPNLEAIKNGEQDADIKQDNAKMGKEGFITLLKVIKGESVPDYVPIDGILITKDNVDDYLQ